MMFCPKCGSIMMPTKGSDGKRVLKCGCGHSSGTENAKLSEAVKQDREIAVVDKEIETLPECDERCPKCENVGAYYWLRQMRASDEPETKFLRCKKCKHTWREND